MRAAVVGHVEWCEFAEVPHVPAPGEIVHATRVFEEPGGGGAVAAVQLKKLAGSATLFTAFGDDEVGHRSHAELVELGLDVEGGFRPETQRRAFVHLDEPGERTITVLGPRLGPRGADPLAWEKLDEVDAVYLTAGDVEAVKQARRARVLVATPRGLDTLADAHVELDALVSSGRDPGELYSPGDLDPEPRVVVRTLGEVVCPTLAVLQRVRLHRCRVHEPFYRVRTAALTTPCAAASVPGFLDPRRRHALDPVLERSVRGVER
jgi:ribokinase